MVLLRFLVVQDQRETSLGEVAAGDEPLDPPMSRAVVSERVVGPGEQEAVDDVGEVALERASGSAGGLALGSLAGQEGLGVGVDAGLDNGDACSAALSWRVPPRCRR